MRKVLLTSLFFIFSLAFFNLQAYDDEFLHAHLVKQGCCKIFGYFYTKNDPVIQREEAIPFDHQNDALVTGEIDHSPGSGDFIIRSPGIYRIIYSVSLKDAGGRVAISLDGNIVPGSQMIIGEGQHLSTLALLVKIAPCHCGKVLRIVNNHSGHWFHHDIQLAAGVDQENVTASLLIEKVANLPNCCDPNSKRDPCGNDSCCKDRCEQHCCHDSGYNDDMAERFFTE
jgi:hypothetical protein